MYEVKALDFKTIFKFLLPGWQRLHNPDRALSRDGQPGPVHGPQGDRGHDRRGRHGRRRKDQLPGVQEAHVHLKTTI